MLPVKFGLNCEHIFVSRLLHKVKCQTITKQRDKQVIISKKISKNNKRYSNLFVSLYRKQVTDMLFRRKKPTIPWYIQSLSKEIQNRRKVGEPNEM